MAFRRNSIPNGMPREQLSKRACRALQATELTNDKLLMTTVIASSLRIARASAAPTTRLGPRPAASRSKTKTRATWIAVVCVPLPNGACTTCDHQYYESVQLSTTWQRYTVAFVDLMLEPGGVPVPMAFEQGAIASVRFRFGIGQNYEVYFDDVAFCEMDVRAAWGGVLGGELRRFGSALAMTATSIAAVIASSPALTCATESQSGS